MISSDIRPIKFTESNINLKILILKKWLIDGVPYERDTHGNCILDSSDIKLTIYYPKSLRNFNKWSCKSYSDEALAEHPDLRSIKSNGSDTLFKFVELKLLAEELINGLNNAESFKKKAPSKIIADNEREIDRLKYIIGNISKEIVIRCAEIQFLKSENEKIKSRISSETNEFSVNYSNLEAENKLLREEVAVLTRQIKKIIPIKSIK